MRTAKRRVKAAILLCCLALASCWSPLASATETAQQRPPAKVDDRSVLHELTRAAGTLIRDGKTTPMATLIGQLGRKQCTLGLAPPTARKLALSEIYRQRREGVLVVAGVYQCKKCTRWHASVASGFLVTGSGAFVTTYHVVNNKAKHTLVAMTCDGKVFAVKEVLAASAADDVAILQLEAAGAKLEPLALAADAPVGTAVGVISHPNNQFYALTHGIVSRYFTAAKDGKRVPVMSITADFARGSSGAPILDDTGAAVGLVRSTTSVYHKVVKGKKENLQMVLKHCVPAARILKLIKPSI